MKFTKLYTVIVEAKIDDLLNNSKLVPVQKTIIRAINDKLLNKSKYVNWLIRESDKLATATEIVDSASFIDEFSNYFAEILNWFEKNYSRTDIPNKDVMSYTFLELRKLYQDLKNTPSKTEIKKGNKLYSDKTHMEKIGDGVLHLTDENPTYELYWLKTHEAANKIYFKKTSWCITQTNDKYWTQYAVDSIFFIVELQLPYPLNYLALQVSYNGNLIKVWNAEDNNGATDITYDWDTLGRNIYIKHKNIISDIVKKANTTAHMTKKKKVEAVLGALLVPNATMSELMWLDESLLPLIEGNFAKVNSNGVVCIGNIDWSLTEETVDLGRLTRIPVKFSEVNGDFLINDHNLTDLKNSPKKVLGSFECKSNELTSLYGAPVSVGHSFSCRSNNLFTLEHGPSIVGINYECSDNSLISLKGAPEKINGWFDCHNNKLTSLDGCPVEVKDVFFSDFSAEEVLKVCKATEVIR